MEVPRDQRGGKQCDRDTNPDNCIESEEARSSPREPRKAPPPFLPIQTTETGLDSSIFRRAQATSKRSWSITLFHAATKSFTNFSLESVHA
jgi:hypothetical protein